MSALRVFSGAVIFDLWSSATRRHFFSSCHGSFRDFLADGAFSLEGGYGIHGGGFNIDGV